MTRYRFVLNALFIISILIIIWLTFFEKLWIPCPTEIDSNKLNNLFEIISLSYFTSFIFYLVVVRFKEKNDKNNLYPFIADNVYVAMNNCIMFCTTMRASAGMIIEDFSTSIHKRNLNIYPNKDEMKIICITINPNEESKDEIEIQIGLQKFRTISHFFGVMIKYAHQIDYYLKIVLEKSSFIDTELLRLLSDIHTHGYHQWMLSYDTNMIYTAKHRHNDLKVFENSLISYFDLFRKLEKYSEKNLRQFVSRESLLTNPNS